VVFVEVKTRAGRRFGDPQAWVTPQKQRRLVAMATEYLARRRCARTAVRFDVVGIDMTAGDGPRVTILPDAFRPGW
jgi:putative endonuclease